MKKLLIANRGEIAVRINETAQSLGIETVAIASEADVHSQHAQVADEVVLIGPPEPSESYLDISKVIQAARETGADAIHPGYGFLSERAEFAEACREANLTFIGPSPEAMRKLGSKIEAKQLAQQANVPIAPGFFEAGASADQLAEAAQEIGFPVLLKASAGGGGRGMRIVNQASEFASQLALAQQEAVKAFGDGAMMVEKLIAQPRHIEVQVAADTHGKIACLFERECSLQRRHQKIVEEAPSPLMDDALWQRMREACEALVRAAGYTGLGTVEFMLDAQTRAFYFLEVNARLQVEHPVTEMITGCDLVELQIQIARGERMNLPDELMRGDRSAIIGHAIEHRIIAEDPSNEFLPSTGRLLRFDIPEGPGIRVDAGFIAGDEISRFYDSLLAKLIAHGSNRKESTHRILEALKNFAVAGVRTNIGFLVDLTETNEFRDGAFDTKWIERVFLDQWSTRSANDPWVPVAVELADQFGLAPQASPPGRLQAWQRTDGFELVSGGKATSK